MVPAGLYAGRQFLSTRKGADASLVVSTATPEYAEPVPSRLAMLATTRGANNALFDIHTATDLDESVRSDFLDYLATHPDHLVVVWIDWDPLAKRPTGNLLDRKDGTVVEIGRQGALWVPAQNTGCELVTQVLRLWVARDGGDAQAIDEELFRKIQEALRGTSTFNPRQWLAPAADP